MTLGETCALLAGGLTAGAVNAIAGGGSLITFPLLVALGLPGVSANVSNALSVVPFLLLLAAAMMAFQTRLRSLAGHSLSPAGPAGWSSSRSSCAASTAATSTPRWVCC